jgi:hypothetical protein
VAGYDAAPQTTGRLGRKAAAWEQWTPDAGLTDAARELLARRCPVSHLLENVMPRSRAGRRVDIAR